MSLLVKMSDDTTFYNAVAAFRAAKARADDIRKHVVVLYELQPYQDANGGQGTRFVCVARGDTMSQLIKCVDEDKSYKDTSVFLAAERLLSAAGDYYTKDGRLANGPPTEGLLRDCLRDWGGAERPAANDEWIPVERVRGGVESEPASAVVKDYRPDGWAECRDKYGINVVFTRGDDTECEEESHDE